jgi:glutathione S-transferase
LLEGRLRTRAQGARIHACADAIRDGSVVVEDSFAIALYLEEAYPDRPTLFAGEGGKAHARFIERWSQLVVHPYLGRALLLDIHDMLDAEGREHFRRTREARFTMKLEDVSAGRDEAGIDAFRASLEPLRSMLAMQPFIGGDAPLFADYVVAGAFQWARVVSPLRLVEPDDPVASWFERCLDLHGGLGRATAAA